MRRDPLADRLDRLERALRAASSTPQLGHSAIHDGGLDEYRGQTLVQRIGSQPDGTNTVVQFNGPVPPTPTAPIVQALQGGLQATWDGQWLDALVAPLDFLRIDVMLSSTDDIDPRLGQIVGSIAQPQMASTGVPLDTGDWYVAFVAWTQSGKQSVSGWSEVVTVSPIGTGSDGNPPSHSPDVTLRALGVTALQGSWPKVDNAGYPVAYDVWVSSVSPVVRDDDHFLVTTAGLAASFGVVNDEVNPGTKITLPADQPAYMVVVARDADGEAAPGAEGSATPRKASIEEIDVEQLNATTIEALQGYIANLQTDIVTTSSRIVIGDESAAHITLDPLLGLLFYASDGQTILMKLDMTDAQLSEFTGKINASSLSVMNGLELRGLLSKLVSSSRFTLAASVADPVAPPTMTPTVGVRPWLTMPSTYTEFGMWWSVADSLWYQLIYRTDGANLAKVRAINADGTQNGATITLDNHIPGSESGQLVNGIVKIGTEFYTLRRATGTIGLRNWYLVKHAANGDFISSLQVASENSAGENTAYPALGYDAGDLVVASLSNKTPLVTTPNQVGFMRLNTDLLFLDSYTQAGDIGSGLFGRGCGIDTFTERGGLRFWVANTGQVFFYTFAAGTITVDPVFPVLALESGNYSVAFDGSNFYSSTGSSTAKFYSRYVATTDAQRTFWAQYAWEAGASATLPSDAASLMLPDGRYLTVGLPSPTSGTSTTRVFTGNGATQPPNSQMYDRGLTGAMSYVVATAATSGANPRTASDFSSGTPAELVSETGGLILRGDGFFAAPKKMQAGVHIPVPSGTGGVNVVITFPHAFDADPAVIPSVTHPDLGGPRITSVSPTGCTFRTDRANAGTYEMAYVAMATD